MLALIMTKDWSNIILTTTPLLKPDQTNAFTLWTTFTRCFRSHFLLPVVCVCFVLDKMNSFLSRANTIFAFTLSVLAALTFGCFLTTAFSDLRTDVLIDASKALVLVTLRALLYSFLSLNWSHMALFANYIQTLSVYYFQAKSCIIWLSLSDELSSPVRDRYR